MTNTGKIKMQFNDLAESLGCRARISGNKRKMEFQEFLGYYTKDGYEVVKKINHIRFCQLTHKYPELHND